MIVDTAATYVTVRPDMFERLDISPFRKHPLVTASELTSAPMGQVEKLTVASNCIARRVQIIAIAFLFHCLPKDYSVRPSVGISRFAWITVQVLLA
jgi:hypothetical protein